MNTIFILWAVSIVWLLLLTIYTIITLRRNEKKLKNADAGKLYEQQERIAVVEKHISVMLKEAKRYVNKVGLVRFNPFKDVGGDQSFSFALLDNEGNGVVISSLHSRATTRTYAKPIVANKSLRHDLSQEEERAIQQARGD